MRNDDTSLIDRRFTEPLPLFDTIEDPPGAQKDALERFDKQWAKLSQVCTEPAEQHAIKTRDNQKQAVLEHFTKRGEYGSTDYETSVALKILRTSAGKRRKELSEQGLIVDSKQRRKTDTGSTAVVWRINECSR